MQSTLARAARLRSQPSRLAAEQRGHWGEQRAAWWLRLHGWRIVGKRVKTPVGEIDLIAQRGNVTAFVEVKTRATAKELDFAIDAYRLRRVAAATNAVAHDYVPAGTDFRIDVILIAPRVRPRHLVNVWFDG
jgi:Holliday junction resolvase-like predicted endonuclease